MTGKGQFQPTTKAKTKECRYRRRAAVFDHVHDPMTLTKKSLGTARTFDAFGYLSQIHAR